MRTRCRRRQADVARVRRLSDGRYAIDGLPGGPFLVLSIQQLQALLWALQEARMIQLDDTLITRPGAG